MILKTQVCFLSNLNNPFKQICPNANDKTHTLLKHLRMVGSLVSDPKFFHDAHDHHCQIQNVVKIV